MDFSNIFVIIFIAGTIFSFLLEMLLERIDFSFRKKHGREIPEIVSSYVDSDTLNKTCLVFGFRAASWRLSLHFIWFSAASIRS